jgi:mono/diheme cytochrome c family protein
MIRIAGYGAPRAKTSVAGTFGRLGLMPLALIVLAVLLPLIGQAVAAEAKLTIDLGGVKRQISAEDLLRDPASVDIEVPQDVAYGHKMRYWAMPLAVLLQGAAIAPDQAIEAVANDGFAAILPLDLIRRQPGGEGSVPYLAIESPHSPWPKLAGKNSSAGPFYIVWLRPEADGIRTEQWPYGVVEIRSSDLPAKRWPVLAVDPKLPAEHPARAGEALYATMCLVCHRLNGAGNADMGPDLNLPMNPTEYFRSEALRAFIRDPAALRHWPAMGMPGFSKEALSEREIDLIIAYLSHMAGRKTPAP